MAGRVGPKVDGDLTCSNRVRAGLGRPGRLQWLVMSAALLALVGTWGDWGALSRVDSQVEVAAPTRWILAGLCLVAGTLAGFAGRTGRTDGLLLAACGVCLAVAVLGWSEWRYEATQAFQYGTGGWPWGLALVQSGGILGAVLSLAGFLRRRQDPRRAGLG